MNQHSMAKVDVHQLFPTPVRTEACIVLLSGPDLNLIMIESTHYVNNFTVGVCSRLPFSSFKSTVSAVVIRLKSLISV